MSSLPHFLDDRLTDGGEVISLTRRPPFTPRKIPGTHVGIKNWAEITKPRRRRRRTRTRTRTRKGRQEVAGKVSHMERKQGAARRKMGKGKQNFKEGKKEDCAPSGVSEN
jgi:hypothetical protein